MATTGLRDSLAGMPAVCMYHYPCNDGAKLHALFLMPCHAIPTPQMPCLARRCASSGLPDSSLSKGGRIRASRLATPLNKIKCAVRFSKNDELLCSHFRYALPHTHTPFCTQASTARWRATCTISSPACPADSCRTLCTKPPPWQACSCRWVWGEWVHARGMSVAAGRSKLGGDGACTLHHGTLVAHSAAAAVVWLLLLAA